MNYVTIPQNCITLNDLELCTFTECRYRLVTQFEKIIQSQLNQIIMFRNTFLPSAPNKTLWFLALLIGGLGILANYTHIEQLSKYNYQMLLIGFLLLVVGTTYRKI